MTRTAQGVLLAILFSVLLCPTAWAQGTYTAASCNESDVNAVINGPTHTAVNGDTIDIPSGTCTWTSGITISSIGITIIGSGTSNGGSSTFGAGTSNTTIIDNVGGSNPLFNVTTPAGNEMRISLLNIKPYTSTTSLFNPIVMVGTCSSSACPNVRVDNVTFSGWTGSNGLYGESMMCISNYFGVLDHDSMLNTGTNLVNPHMSSYLGVGSLGDNSFAQPDTYGTANTLYVENNLFTNGAFACDTDFSTDESNVGGGRIAIRFNQVTGLGFSFGYFHGTETSDRPRGGRQMELYGNAIGCTGNCVGVLATVRSGTALFFGNAVTVSGSGAAANGIVVLYILRAYRGPSTPWGVCDGSGPYDDNDGTTYASGTITTGGLQVGSITDSGKNWTSNQWFDNGAPFSIHDVTQNFGDEIAGNTATAYSFTSEAFTNTYSPWTWNVGDSYQILRATVCIDQPGRGAGSYISGTTPTAGWVNEVLDPIYEWGDTVTGTYYNPGISAFNNGTNRLLANRDWYQGAPGIQTSATNPFNGTSGTGWGPLADRPSTCTQGVGYYATDQGNWNATGQNLPGQSFSQGELFVCSATNTWKLYYTPYTYPHPLDRPDPATKLNATGH